VNISKIVLATSVVDLPTRHRTDFMVKLPELGTMKVGEFRRLSLSNEKRSGFSAPEFALQIQNALALTQKVGSIQVASKATDAKRQLAALVDEARAVLGVAE
jgi:hypothetical protein